MDEKKRTIYIPMPERKARACFVSRSPEKVWVLDEGNGDVAYCDRDEAVRAWQEPREIADWVVDDFAVMHLILPESVWFKLADSVEQLGRVVRLKLTPEECTLVNGSAQVLMELIPAHKPWRQPGPPQSLCGCWESSCSGEMPHGCP